MCYNILILCSNSQNNPNSYETLVPPCVKILSKICILDITPTVFEFADQKFISTQKCKIVGMFLSLYERFIRNLRMIKFNS